MSIRTATMSNAYSSSTPHPGFFRKLAVALLFVVNIAGLMALLNFYQKNISSFWMTVFAILGIGMASGAISRFAFYHWSGFIRFVVILLTLPLGLFMLGVWTNWQMGIGPLNPWARGIIPQDELIQLSGAFLVAILCLEAWWEPRPKITDMSDVRGLSLGRQQAPAAAPIQSARPRSSRARAQENSSSTSKKVSHLKFMKPSRTRSRKSSVVDKSLPARISSPTRSRRKPKLQLSVFEEHRCPYCLDEVKRNDPRGVKECEVCHSLHHADCWAVTGMCQVPHLNT